MESTLKLSSLPNPGESEATALTVSIKYLSGDSRGAGNIDGGLILRATGFRHKGFGVILADTDISISVPPGIRMKLAPTEDMCLNGVTVANTYPEIKDGEGITVVLGAMLGQPPFLPNGNKRSAKVGNMDFSTGDPVARVFFEIEPPLEAVVIEWT